ncbi:MAG: hypothetical protein Alpg2KO_26320 [Alphaproteobacteria bacterium]
MALSTSPLTLPTIGLYPLGLPEAEIPQDALPVPFNAAAVEISGASLSGMGQSFAATTAIDGAYDTVASSGGTSTGQTGVSVSSSNGESDGTASVESADAPAVTAGEFSVEWTVGDVEVSGPVYKSGGTLSSKADLAEWDAQNLSSLQHLKHDKTVASDDDSAAEIISLKPALDAALVEAMGLDLGVLQADPDIAELWGLNNTGQTGGTPDADIDAFEAWEIASGEGVVVAVIDTGVDLDHEDLADNIWVNEGEIAGNGIDDDGNGYIDDVNGYDFHNSDGDPDDDNGHGTHVSGTIAALRNNGIGVAGVAHDAEIMALKGLGSFSGTDADIAEAIIYAVDNGADIVNMSLGGPGFSQVLLDAVNYAGENDVLLVAAAGNDGLNNDFFGNYPSNYAGDHMIAVASSTHNEVLSGFSNTGLVSVDVAAPGSLILSTTPGDDYQEFSGTSMATPHVAGIAALLMQEFPDYSAAEIRAQILNTVDLFDSYAGAFQSQGRANAYTALTSEAPPVWEEPEAPEIEDDWGNDTETEGVLSVDDPLEATLE